MPESWMWHLDWEIEKWFEHVKVMRDQKYGTSSGVSDNEDWGEWEDNALTARFKD